MKPDVTSSAVPSAARAFVNTHREALGWTLVLGVVGAILLDWFFADRLGPRLELLRLVYGGLMVLIVMYLYFTSTVFTPTRRR